MLKTLAKSNPMWFRLSIYLLMLGASFIIYSNILKAGFVYDDVVFRENPAIHITHLGQIFEILLDPHEWRRVGQATFALNFYVGGLEPFGYHVFNIFLHALNGLLLFLVTLNTLSLPSLREEWKDRAVATALLGAMIWLVHPVQIMAVTYTVQRFTSLSSLFFLLSLYFYIRGRYFYIRGRLSRRGRRIGMYSLCAFCAVLAFGSKENSAVLPLVIFLYEVLFFTDESARKNRRRLLFGAVATGGLIILLALIYMGPDMGSTIMNNSAGKGWHPCERFITQFRVIFLYMTLLIWPNPARLNVDYDFSLSKGLFSPPSTFLSLVLLAAIIAFAITRFRKNPLLSFALLWFFVNLAIESSFLPLDLVYEHRLYLPSMGPIMLFAGWICSIKKRQLKKVGISLAIVFMLALACWTRQRNVVWQDPVRLWEDNVMKSPKRARVYGNLGKAYLDKGKYEKARLAFEKTIALDPTFLGAYNNLATIHIDHFRQYKKARQYLHEAIRRNPDYPSPYLNLGVVHLQLRELAQAVQAFEKLLELDPENLLGHYNLAAAYFNLKKYDQVISILQRGIEIWPRSARLYALLGVTYYHQKEDLRSQEALRRALQLDPFNKMAGGYMKKLQRRDVPSKRGYK